MNNKKQNRILVFLNDSNKKNVLQICKEFIVLLFIKKEIPKYYFKHFYKKEFKNYRSYLGTRHGNLIKKSKKLHKYEHTSLMKNKLVFSLYCEKYLLSTPKLIGYNLGTSFFYNNILKEIFTKEDLMSFFTEVFNQSLLDELFIRPLSSQGGKGCFKLKKEDISLESVEKYREFLKGSFLYTEIINQHPEINAIHNKSINTIRLITYIDNDNNIHIIAGFMRFGIGDNVVDNASSGGFFVGIDLKDGSLREKGYYHMEYGGNEVKAHPDSLFELGGFRIPFFKEVCELVIKAVKHIPNRFIGWDIALTPDGPTLIEANENPSLHSIDVAYDGLLRNPYIKNLIDELK